jgi:hypothetical protein
MGGILHIASITCQGFTSFSPVKSIFGAGILFLKNRDAPTAALFGDEIQAVSGA